jgi:hypothetical protein
MLRASWFSSVRPDENLKAGQDLSLNIVSNLHPHNMESAVPTSEHNLCRVSWGESMTLLVRVAFPNNIVARRPLLGNDCEMSKYTTAVTEKRLRKQLCFHGTTELQ